MVRPVSPSVICFANATSLVRGRLFPWPPLTRGLSSAARLGERSPRFPRRARPLDAPRAHAVRPYGWCNLVGAGLARAVPSFRGPEGAVGIRLFPGGIRIAASGLRPSSQ